MKATEKRAGRRRFAPTCQQLEGRALLAPILHSVSTRSHYFTYPLPAGQRQVDAGFQMSVQGDVSKNGQEIYYLPPGSQLDLRVLNAAVGSKVSLYASVQANNLISQPQMERFSSIRYAIDEGPLVSALPSDTSYTFAEGKYKTSQAVTHTAFTSAVGMSGVYFDTMGPDIPYFGYLNGDYDVDHFSFFAGPTPGVKHVRVHVEYNDWYGNTIGQPEDIVFNLNVVSPQAELNSALATGSFRWGPVLKYSQAQIGAEPTYYFAAADWDDPAYANADPFPEVGIQRNYLFGGIAPGLYPNRFDGTGTNTTPTPGKFYIVQLARVNPSDTDIHDLSTGQTTSWTTESPLAGDGSRAFGLDAYNKSIDIPWSIGAIGDTVVSLANSGADAVPDPGNVLGYNGQTLSFNFDSPSAAIPTTENHGSGSMTTGRNSLLDGVQYHLDLKTYLVFQATDAAGAFTGIPVALLEKDWSVNISMTNINPVKSWENSYTIETNWEGTAILTAGVAIGNPQLLEWHYNVPALVANPLGAIQASSVTPVSLDPATPSGQAWTFSGESGVDTLTGGGHAAYLYGGSWTSSIGQSFDLPASTYTFLFDAAQYSGYDPSWSPALSVDLVVDGNVVATYTPSGEQFSAMSSSPIALAAGTHSIAFRSHAPLNWEWGWLDDVRPYFYNYIKDIKIESATTPATGAPPATFVAATGAGTAVSNPGTSGIPIGDSSGERARISVARTSPPPIRCHDVARRILTRYQKGRRGSVGELQGQAES